MEKKITCFAELLEASETVRVNISCANDHLRKKFNLDDFGYVLESKWSIRTVLSVYCWDFNIITYDVYFKISSELDSYFESLISDWKKRDRG